MASGQLDVTVLGARGLRDLRTLGKMDPYATVTVGGRSYRTKSNDSGGINPVWSEHFAFAVGPNDKSMTVAVFDTARMGSDERVGEAVIPLSRALSSGRDDSRYSLEHKNKVVGELSLILVFTPAAPQDAPAPAAAPSGPVAPVPIGTAVAGSAARFAGMVPLPEVHPSVSEAVLPNFKAAQVQPTAPKAPTLPGVQALPTAPQPLPLPAPAAPPPAPPVPAPAPYGAPPPAPYVAPPPAPYGGPAVPGYGAPAPGGWGAGGAYGAPIPPAPAPRTSLPGAVGYSAGPQAPYGGPVQGYSPAPHLPNAAGYAVALQVPHYSSVPSSVMAIPPGTPTVPILLLDTTGSMQFPCSARTQLPRRELVRDALGTLVASIEQRQGPSGVGLRTIAFGGGAALDLGYLSTHDFGQQWQRLSWTGGTYITPAWQCAYGTYCAEAGASGAALLAVLLTDGEAADLQSFEAALAADPRVHMLVALVGFGADHDASFTSFMALAARNPRVKLVSFTGEQNARAIGETLSRIVLYG